MKKPRAKRPRAAIDDDVIGRGAGAETVNGLGREEIPPAPAPRGLLSDMGNAQRLIALHGARLRYVYPWKRWLEWDGIRWRPDSGAAIARLAKRTVTTMIADAERERDDDRRKALLAWCLKSQDARRISAMIELARCEPGIPVEPDELDADPMVLNVANGVLDLRTGILEPHTPERLLTKLAPVAYDPDALCLTWDRFLARIFDGNAALIGFVQQAMGYALTGVIREHVMMILHGVGANGKSTLLETAQAVLGDYALHTPVQTLMARSQDSIPNDVARLRGSRLVVATEAEHGQKLAEATVKTLTGGDLVSARYMRAEWFQFAPTFKLFLATNHRPVIKGTDHAIWRRLRLVPFSVVIPDEEQDEGLKDKLLLEAPGILRWMIDGCRAWQADGLGLPDEVRTATGEYRASMDVLGDFLRDRCEVTPTGSVLAATLFAAYRSWCEAAGEKAISKRAFGQDLGERGFQSDRTRSARFWTGIALQPEADA